jgi:pyruvate dehydrogenase E2 component (dihydrolipoamide acetyltransferase)
MPSLGADMEAGTLVQWLVKPGDLVKRGDIVAVVETQKGAIEIETFQPGQIEQILVDLNSKVPVGTPLARIRAEGEVPIAPPPPVAAPPPPTAAVPPPVTVVPPTAIPPAPPPPAAPTVVRPRVSPAARRLAATRNISLDGLIGSGPGGAIVYADVARALAKPAAPAVPPERKRAPALDLAAMRTAIAAAMARAKREIPHYYLSHEVDVTPCEHWLVAKNANLPPDNRLLMGALAIKATALDGLSLEYFIVFLVFVSFVYF